MERLRGGLYVRPIKIGVIRKVSLYLSRACSISRLRAESSVGKSTAKIIYRVPNQSDHLFEPKITI
jgi:hypothetical protein